MDLEESLRSSGNGKSSRNVEASSFKRLHTGDAEAQEVLLPEADVDLEEVVEVPEFEDNRLIPSRFSSEFLLGRNFLSGCGSQELSAEWIFQRCVNWFMQLVTKPEKPWYHVQVDRGDAQQESTAYMVKWSAWLLSPLLIPIIFLGALVFLVPLAPCTVSRLRQVRRVTLEREGDTTERFTGRVTDDARHSYTAIVRTIFQCVWFLGLTTFPWVYILKFGDYACDVTPQCAEEDFHFSPMFVFTPIFATMISALRWTHNLDASSTSCAVYAQQIRYMSDPVYGPAMSQIINKLGDPKDELSYFPIYVRSEKDETDALPLKKRYRAMLWIVSILCGILPHLWYVYAWDEPLVPTDEAAPPQIAMLLTGFLASCWECHQYLTQFFIAIEELKDVTHELLIFISIGCKASSKARPTQWEAFRDVVLANDRYRKLHAEHFQASLSERVANAKSFACLNHGTERFNPSGVSTKALKNAGFEPGRYSDELEKLHMYQVAFNFKRKEGVLLFRMMRKWIVTDILNERLEVEQFIMITLHFLLMGAFILFGSFLGHKVTAIDTVIALMMVVLLSFILRAVEACAQANSYLFEGYERVLLDWQEEALDPRSSFETKGRKPAVGWIWDQQAQQAVPLEFSSKLSDHDKGDNGWLDRIMELARTTNKLLEERQKILGFEVTFALRNRVVASLGSVVLAALAKVPMVWHMKIITDVTAILADKTDDLVHTFPK